MTEGAAVSARQDHAAGKPTSRARRLRLVRPPIPTTAAMGYGKMPTDRPKPGIWSFNHPINLGGRCAIAVNIQRYYGMCFKSPFDWWHTPLLGLIGLLSDNDPERLYDPQSLAEVDLWGGTEVFNRRYGIQFTHSFPKDEDKRLTKDWQADPLNKFRLVTKRLWEYFVSADEPDARILFFRLATAVDLHESTVLHISDLLRLKHALAKIFSRSDFRIVLINYPSLEAEASIWHQKHLASFVFATVDHSSQMDWKGPPKEWDAAFSRMPFQYDATFAVSA